jgi:Nif-specific regulatory protein
MLKLNTKLEEVEALVQKGKFSQALAALREILPQLKEDAYSIDRGTISYLLAATFYGLGRYQEALAEGKKAYQVFKNTLENKRIAQILYVLGKTYIGLGDFKDAEAELRDAIATYRRIEDFDGITDSYNKLAHIYFVRSEFARSIEYLNESIQICEKTQNQRLLAQLLANVAVVYIRSGEFSLAEKNMLSAIKIHKEQKNELNLARCYLSLGYIRFLKRDFPRAEEIYLESLPLIEKNKLIRELAIYYEYSGELAFEKREHQKAKEFYLKAIEIGEKIAPDGDIINQSFRLLAELQLSSNQLEEALNSCEKSLKVSLSLHSKLEEGAVYRLLGQIHTKKDEKEKALQYFLKGIDLFREIGAKYELAKTTLKAAQSRLFDHQESLNYLRESERIFKGLEIPLWVGLTLIQRAEVQITNDNFDNSISSLDQAQNIFSELKDKYYLDLILSLRNKVEKAISEKSLSVDNEYRLFRRDLSEGEYKGVQAGSLDESLQILAHRISADRGFVVLNNSEEDFSVSSAYNFNADKAAEIFSDLFQNKKEKMEKPLIQTNATLENGNTIQSLICVPLKTGEKIDGHLYLDRVVNGEQNSAFNQNQLNFAVAFADVIALKLVEIQKRKLEEDNLRLKEQLQLTYCFPNVITQNSDMLKTLWKLKQVKDSSISILLEGDTGTGKDLVAKAIHYSSNRKNQKFVPVNCAALPESLFESELFGHRKGAYTGAAYDKKGLLEEADGGTLYLDEVGDMHPSIQIKLLRVLEDKELTRLGETKPRKIDIRIISATNKNMEEEVQQGGFRMDLFYRLNAVHIKFTPLKDRREDIPVLVDHFIKTYSDDPAKFTHLIPLILELFANYDWPGNVRELENEVKRLLAFNRDTKTPRLDILSDKFTMPSDLQSEKLSLYDRVALWERQYIIKALIDSNWVKKAAADALHIPESSLRFKIKQYKIKKPD